MNELYTNDIYNMLIARSSFDADSNSSVAFSDVDLTQKSNSPEAHDFTNVQKTYKTIICEFINTYSIKLKKCCIVVIILFLFVCGTFLFMCVNWK